MRMSFNRGRDLYKLLRPAVLFSRVVARILPQKLALAALQASAISDALPTRLAREGLLHRVASGCGDLVDIRRFVTLLGVGNLTLGDRVSIHPYSYIDATGGISIGNDVSIAHSCTLMSTAHNFSSLDLPIRDQGISMASVSIGNGVWLGAEFPRQLGGLACRCTA